MAIACTNWLTESLHYILATVYIPTDLAIRTALESDPDTNILGTFTSTDANV